MLIKSYKMMRALREDKNRKLIFDTQRPIIGMTQQTPAGAFEEREHSHYSGRLVMSTGGLIVTNLHRRKATVLVSSWGHAHGRVDWWRRRRAVGRAGRAGVVLRATPAKADTGVADRVTLHLVDSHLSGVALDELDETAALARGDLDVGDLAKALEEGTELILSHVARQTTNEDGGVVGVSELVHGLRSTVEAHGRTTHGRGVKASGSTGHAHGTRTSTRTLVLGGGSRDTHGAVAAVDALHFGQSTLLVVLVGETNETVAARHAADGVRHDLGGLAGREAALEEGDQDVFVHLGAEVTNEDGVLRATVVTARINLLASSIQAEAPTSAYLRSARPPPVAQFSLKGRVVLGIGVLLRDRALAAAAGEEKSTKQ